MNWPQTLDLLERIQTSLVGLVIFLGVILTLHHNAKQAARNHAKQIAHERKIVRVALLAELEINRSSLKENVRRIELAIQENAKRQDSGGQGVLVPSSAMTDAYESFLPQIGLLGAEQTKLVMYAYLVIKTAYSKLPLFSQSAPIGENFEVAPDQLPALKGMWENLIPDTDCAISALKKQVNH